MGGFYGSLQFRSEDRDAVVRLAEGIAEEGGAKFLCGPALGGWVGLYPHHHGQDERVASALAERWPGEVFHLLVHDDDVFVYRYFRAGERVDAYFSVPGYFGKDGQEEQEREVGAPRAYAPLITGKIERVVALLDRKQGRWTEELDRLLEFATLLGIANAGTSYEYLENGERDGIRGWRQFVHVPDRAGERLLARRTRAARNAEHKRLIAAGVLLAVLEDRDAIMPKRSFEFRGKSFAFEHGPTAAHPDGSSWVRATVDSVEMRSGEGLFPPTLRIGFETADAAPYRDLRWELWMSAEIVRELEPGRALAVLLRTVPPAQRPTVESHLRRVLPAPPWTAEQVQCLIQIVGHATATREGAHVLLFSREGDWLVCGNGKGLRVAAWKEMLAAPDGAPVPWRHVFDVPPYELVPNPSHGHVYAAVHDAANDCVIFGGKDGRVRTMSLADGCVEELLELCDRAPILGMTFVDASMMAVLAEPGFPESRGRLKGVKRLVYLWNYPALLERVRSGIRPIDPPLPPHATVSVSAEEEGHGSPFPVHPAITALRAAHEKSPREIRLEPAGDVDWPDALTRRRLVAPLAAAGFVSGERFVVPALGGMYVQFFAHADERMVGTLLMTPERDPILTLACVGADATSFAYTSAPSDWRDLPPGRVLRHDVGANAVELLELLKQNRPEGPWLALTVDEMPKRFESHYAIRWAWRNERGFTIAEVARLMAAQTKAKSY